METLESDEAASSFRRHELFDVWVYGSDVAAVELSVGETSIDGHAAESMDRNGGGDAVAYRGLDREIHLEAHSAGHALDLRLDADAPVELSAIFVMPYHGSHNFHTDGEIGEIIHRDYRDGAGQLTTFSLGQQMWPDGAPLSPDDSLETRIQIPNRRVVTAHE